MPRLSSPIVYDLLDVATALSETRGRTGLRKVAYRRAVSTAYYAVFHALCFICASELLGWKQPAALLEPVYRLLDHGSAKQRLKARSTAAFGGRIVDIANNFVDLQEARNLADYSPPTLPVRYDETLRLIALAAETVALIEQLSTSDRKQLAVLLIAKPRPA